MTVASPHPRSLLTIGQVADLLRNNPTRIILTGACIDDSVAFTQQLAALFSKHHPQLRVVTFAQCTFRQADGTDSLAPSEAFFSQVRDFSGPSIVIPGTPDPKQPRFNQAILEGLFKEWHPDPSSKRCVRVSNVCLWLAGGKKDQLSIAEACAHDPSIKEVVFVD